jgi:hypothetical protein
MSRALAAVIALMLGLPVIAFAAAGVAVGINPSIYSGVIEFVLGVVFLGAVALEIHRLATTRSDDLLYGWMPKQAAGSDPPISLPPADRIEGTHVEVSREPNVAGSDPVRVKRAG